MASKRKIVAAVIFLLSLHLAILLAGFVAPYNPATQNRGFPFAPPTRVHFVDAAGHFHARPFIYPCVARPNGIYEYEESREHQYPVHFVVAGPEYKIISLWPSRVHLFGGEAPWQIFLCRTDN